MANDNPDLESGQVEAPRGNTTNNTTTANTSASRRSPQSESQKPETSPPRPGAAPPVQKQNSSNLVPATTAATTSSAGASPRTSRNTSPVRKDGRQQPLSNPPSTQPSAAAIQRALSAANVPQLQAGGVTEAVSNLPKPVKSAGASGDNTPRWPTSPRLKSPPPSATNSRRGSATTQQQQQQQKKSDGGVATAAPPNISVQNATPQTSTPPPAKQGGDETAKVQQQQQQQQLQTPVKGSARGASGKSTLETVQENSADDIKEPSPAAVKAAADLKPLTKLSEDDGKTVAAETINGEVETRSLHGESGSESAGAKNDKKKDQGTIASRPKNGTAKSYASLAPTKSRQPEGKQNMTVETETVQSIPQSALNAGDRSGGTRNENSGSVRLKPSIETIRPKKERKKTAQKARSINQGTASSKADIFEARVANAVDEVNSSDSEETFVYESNPPEPQRRALHHSRTPSVTSSHSVADGPRSGAGIRSFGDAMDERRVAGKRSMKFSNNAYSNDGDTPDGGSKDGSVRSHTPRHFGRFGRGGSHASMFDPDSPFTQASKLRSQQLGVRNSRPGSPRSPQSAAQQAQAQQRGTSGLFGKKTEPSYDFDAEGADDERTPLVGTVRTSRRLPRRISSRAAGEIDEYYGVRRHPRCGRFGGCMLGFVVFAAAILAAVAFLVMSNRPMYDVRIHEIQNVLASEQELILDLLVGAVNPNALGISVGEMNVDVFAKSKHVGSGEVGLTTSESVVRQRRRRQALPELPTQASDEDWQDLSTHWHAPSPAGGGVDHGTDPPHFPDDDFEHDAQTMLLGRIYHFDQGLEFEGSPLKRHVHYSVGEVRLSKPGNRTEAGGSAKWEEVIQYPFELIIRGVLKYQLPISSRVESAAVGATILVHPEDGVDEFGRMRVHQVDRSEEWEWIEWEDLKDWKGDDGEVRMGE